MTVHLFLETQSLFSHQKQKLELYKEKEEVFGQCYADFE